MSKDLINTAVKNFVARFTGMEASKIFIAYQNKISMPADNDYCVISLISDNRQGTPIEKYKPIEMEYEIKQHHQAVLQIDFYGQFALERANAIIAVSRSLSGADYLKSFGVQPLYCENWRNMTIVSGEKQYVERYMVELNIEYDNTLVVAQDGFNKANINLIKTEM